MTFPVDLVLPELSTALAGHAACVLVAEPGAGKTTRVPLALRDAPWLNGKKIVMLEPRRLAARASAKRMADTLGETVGETVGYTVRLERKVTDRTRIEVVTEGILTRRLQSDPELSDTGLVIFDEFHERSLDGDFGLALTLDVQRGLRPDLKILVMSATLDTEALCAHLDKAPLVQASGRMFPVAVTHLERPTRFSLIDDTVKAVQRALREVKGSLLVFLPGEGEIRRTAEALAKINLPPNTQVLPLYGALSFAEQDEAIRKPEAGQRKIVLATTIAETSLTIEGVEAVIDTGLKRAPRFDPASGMTALETVRVSQASAEQRKGRAGRLGPGHCYRLWPEAESKALAAHDAPEIRVADLAPLALDMANWGVTEREGLPWLEAPLAAPFAQAQELLQQLGGIDGNRAITPHGKAMVRLPLHPRLAHMVVKAHDLGAARAAAETAAMIAERDGLPREVSADIETRLLHLRGTARDRIRQSARQIMDLLKCGEDKHDIPHGVLLGLAYPDRIAQRRGSNRFRMANGGGAVVAEHDPLAKVDFIAIALLDNAQADAKVFLAAVLKRDDIEAHFADLITTRSRSGWDTKQNAVAASTTRVLGAVILEERSLPQPDADVLVEGMIAGVRAMGLSALPWSEGAQGLRQRVQFLARTMPDAGWPDLSDGVLLGTLETWLSPYLAGMKRKADLERIDLATVLRGLVPHSLLSRLDGLAPVRMEVPNGAHYRIDYDTEGDPVLRVRLQEMFGMHTAPQVADGRARLRIELLSPAGRPVAVTQSLETFWVNAYADVRKDLRGRYPKHYWPENPLEAQAVAPRRLR
ncbi:MAG: ATP-dependent helicase HrpB [Phyllobacteriaceae bacterium]|nr:ATP-dependent helicase HrpB [Phyllobacteriaceae bacterium]